MHSSYMTAIFSLNFKALVFFFFSHFVTLLTFCLPAFVYSFSSSLDSSTGARTLAAALARRPAARAHLCLARTLLAAFHSRALLQRFLRLRWLPLGVTE